MGLVDRPVSLLITSTANDSQLQTLFNYLIRYGDVSRVSEFIREVAERSPPSQGEADDNCRGSGRKATKMDCKKGYSKG